MGNEDYDKKIARCKKLGADKFKKAVDLVEKLKFKVLKNIFPGYIKRYDKRMDKFLERELKKLSTEEEKKALIREVQRQKMAIRKEHNFEQNRNYHVDENNPQAIINYLKWNKEVHKHGLIRNAISIGVMGVVAIKLPLVVAPFLVMEGVDAFLNWQCINIQNCNIYRYEKEKDKIEKYAQRREERNIKKYGQFAKVVGKSLEKEQGKLPTPKELTKAIKTDEELLQAIDITIEQLKKRGNTEKIELLTAKKQAILTNQVKGKVKVYD